MRFIEEIKTAKSFKGANDMQTRHFRKEMQAIIDSAHDGIIVVDQDAKVHLINRHAMDILGLPDHIIGSKITEFIPKSDLIRILKTGKTEIGDIATVLNRKLIINRLPIIDNGQLIGVVSSFKEIDDIQRMEMKIRKNLHQRGLEAKYQLNDIVGSSDVMQECKSLAHQFGKTEATVMILGESGTGKELFAQGIHLSSTRAKGPFVAINCAALPDSLLESELFGYEEGTFTGASKDGKMGVFEQAHGGTIFLDEIGEMPPQIQTMLLRTIEEREIRRLGSQKVTPIDVRIIVATNQNLEQMLEEGTFRTDLFFRLNVLTLELPPLRDRLGDLADLIESILNELNNKNKTNVKTVDEEVVSLFYQYNWRGNVRELRNVLERMVLLANTDTLTMEDAAFLKRKIKQKPAASKHKLSAMEEASIRSALEEENGNKTETAKKLGIDRSTLWRKMKKYQL